MELFSEKNAYIDKCKQETQAFKAATDFGYLWFIAIISLHFVYHLVLVLFFMPAISVDYEKLARFLIPHNFVESVDPRLD